MRIVQEQPDDWWEVEALYDLCFAPGREALSSYRLRDGVPPVADLCFVARDGENILAGAIRYWPARVGNKTLLLLGPIAVHPTRQGEGVGAQLIQHSLGQARIGNDPRVLLVGDAGYYGRFGFEHNPHIQMPPPTDPARVLTLALTPNAWADISGAVQRI